MAKKLRKTLGDVNAPSTVALMDLIDTQSRDTIRAWCIDYAEREFLPIFERRVPGDHRPRSALEAARAYVAGDVRLADVKQRVLRDSHQAAKELDHDPAGQAAARAVGQGSAVVQTLSHSLGMLWYGAAAVAYDRLGLAAPRDDYDAIAEEVSADMFAALEAIAIVDEPHPAKIQWYC